MAPRSDDTHSLSAPWKARVRAELTKQGRGSHSKLARAIGCSTGQLTELLGPKSKYSNLVPAIHEFLGWDPPQTPIPGSRDTGTIRYLVDRANDEQAAYLLDAANMLLRAPDAEATKALMSMLKAFRTAFDPLRELRAAARVLVVDADSAHLRAVERSCATNNKVALLMTDNAIDGMLLVGTTRPHLVVLDAALDGIELCRRVRANPDTADVQIAIAYSGPVGRLGASARGAGAWGVTPKPIDLVQLLAQLIGS